jgi:YD repeat-containing protein
MTSEFDYRSDGLLERIVASGGPPCERRFGYVLDASGQAITVYDPSSCTLIEQIDRDAGWLEVTRTYSATRYELFPDGGVSRRSFSSAYGPWQEEHYDERGRPLAMSGTDGTTTSTVWQETWIWSDAGLLEHHRSQTGNGVSHDLGSNDIYSYDAGTLVRMEHSEWHWSSTGEVDQGWAIDYSYPDAGVRLAQTTADGGVTALERDYFDARGNLVRAEAAVPPELTSWYNVLTRSYDCFNSK